MFTASSGCKQKQAEVGNVFCDVRVQAEGGQAEAGNVLPMCSASPGSRQNVARLKLAMQAKVDNVLQILQVGSVLLVLWVQAEAMGPHRSGKSKFPSYCCGE